jgi:hypothetical protein
MREKCRLRVLENRVLRKASGRKRYEVTGEWRRLHNEELNALHSCPNIIRVIKSRMTWAGHVTRMGNSGMHTGFWCGDPRKGDHFVDLGTDGKIISKWISKTWDGQAWTALM